MGETGSTAKAPKKSFLKGLQTEFSKIIWPDEDTVKKQTRAVVSVSIVLGLIIAAIDTAIVYVLHFVI